MAKFLSM